LEQEERERSRENTMIDQKANTIRRSGPRFAGTHDADAASFIRGALKHPMLTADEEVALARRWADHGDVEASDQLVTSHLRLVVKMAMGYRGYGLPVDDLISQGNLGLVQAVQRFDPERGFRLSTYAMWWIRAAIQEYIINSWSMVKMGTTADQKKLFFNLRRIKMQLRAWEEGDLTPENTGRIATSLGVSEAAVTDMNRRLSGSDPSLNAPVRAEGESQWQDFLVDGDDNQEERLAARQEGSFQRRLLAGAMRHLTEREREIVAARHLVDSPATLEVLGRRFGVSRERVRQIEGGALGKLKKAVGGTHDESHPALFARGGTGDKGRARAA
jgi:RNA polymerase sigma-32 factor